MMPQATDEQLNLILNALDTSGHGRVTSEDFFKNFSALAASFKEEQAVQDSSVRVDNAALLFVTYFFA